MMLAIICAGLAAWVWSYPVWMGHKPGIRPTPRVDLALICDLLCVAIEAGASLPRACQAVGTVSHGTHAQALLRAAHALRLGAGWEEAWGEHVLGFVLAPAWQDGADPTPLLQQLSRAIRANRSDQAKKAAARLSVQLVLPVGLCLLPAFILLGVVPLLISGSLTILG